MKVIFMGTPDIAVPALEKIIEAGHEVVLVVSQPDKPVGRSKVWRPFHPVLLHLSVSSKNSSFITDLLLSNCFFLIHRIFFSLSPYSFGDVSK